MAGSEVTETTSRWAFRRRRGLSAAAVAALFAVPACGGDATRTPASGTSTTSTNPTTSSIPPQEGCTTLADGRTSCVVPGRPVRRRRRRGFLLPAAHGTTSEEARAEYGSVAAFGELALELLAVGAPPDLVARCHRAALQEIGHAEMVERAAGRAVAGFGPMPGLLGRRIGGRRRRRTSHLARIAAASFEDGWRNEAEAARELEQRAAEAATAEVRETLSQVAAEEREHALLARDVVLWCHEQAPRTVGRALARV